MQTKTVDVREAQADFVALISLVTAGTEVVLTEGNTPVARIIPMTGATALRIAGLHAGAIWTSEDFDEPLPEKFWTGEP